MGGTHKTPHLRDISRLDTEHIFNSVSLAVDHSLKQANYRIDTETCNGRIPAAPHTHRPQAIAGIGLRSLHAVHEVLINRLIVLVVRPRPEPLARVKRAELVLRAHHRLRVRTAQHNPPRVRQRLVSRVVDLEHGSPDGRPQVVRAQPQEQLEHVAVERAAIPDPVRRVLVVPLHPARQARLLVVQEDPAVLHGRRALDLAFGQDEYLFALLDRHVGPPVPGADADLLADVV